MEPGSAHRFSAGPFQRQKSLQYFVHPLMILNLLAGWAGCRQAGGYTSTSGQINQTQLTVS